MSELLDNPNQQVVREDGSGPGLPAETVAGDAEEEVAGPEVGPEAEAAGEAPSLDEMTKAQLRVYAEERGYIEPGAAMTKEDIRAVIDQNE